MIERKGDKPTPDNLEDYLNTDQLVALHKIEGFGWSLKYIRHPAFQETVVVVTNPEGNSIGILEDDGRVNLQPDIKTRE